MELFDAKGCLREEGLQALVGGQLDETQRLEAAEHLAYCDRCMDRYTALLTADALETPPKPLRGAVMSNIWVRLMQNTYGRVAVAGVAAVLALTMLTACGGTSDTKSTADKVADIINVSPSIVSNYERSERVPSLEILVSLARLYQCSTDYLLGFQTAESDNTLDVSMLSSEQKMLLQKLLSTMKS